MVAIFVACVIVLAVIITGLLGFIRRANGIRVMFEMILQVYEAFIINLKESNDIENSATVLHMENAIKVCINSKIIDMSIVRDMVSLQNGHSDISITATDADCIHDFALLLCKINKHDLERDEVMCKS